MRQGREGGEEGGRKGGERGIEKPARRQPAPYLAHEARREGAGQQERRGGHGVVRSRPPASKRKGGAARCQSDNSQDTVCGVKESRHCGKEA